MVERPQPTPTTVQQHLAGSAESWHGIIAPDSVFQPEKDRYHLYVGLFCPFAHRALLIRELFNLQEVLPISIVRPYPKGNDAGWPGWRFPKDESEYPAATVDHLFGSEYLHEVYFKADPEYKGRYSVPLLWDKQTSTVVNNESAEMLRWMQGAFDGAVDTQREAMDLYPEHLRAVIDDVSIWMQRDLNTGVYKAGFAQTQEEYDQNVPPVFAALNRLEKMLSENGGPYLLGQHLTELDVRAYCTIIRFDVVYVQHFKTNLDTIRHGYPQIDNWLRRLYWSVPGFKETTDFKHIKENYTKSHGDINPRAITPLGPYPDIEEGWEADVSKVRIGGVKMKEVVALEEQLQGGFVRQE